MRCLPPDFSFEGARCLDFGCGIGRVIRHFAKEAEVGEFWGCDIDGTSMLWSTENLAPPFRFFQLSDFPTIPLESSSFDLVYALGVFSQLFQDWSALAMEIRRVLKPGGVFFLSFNGQISFEEQFRRPYRSFFADTGLFVSHPFRAWNKGGPAVAMSPDWIKTHWGAMFDIDYIAMEGFGDYQSFASCVNRPRAVSQIPSACSAPRHFAGFQRKRRRRHRLAPQRLPAVSRKLRDRGRRRHRRRGLDRFQGGSAGSSDGRNRQRNDRCSGDVHAR